MKPSLKEIIDTYEARAPLAEASTIPAAWYTDEHVFRLEKQTVFGRSWQFAARVDQLREPGDFVTTDIAGEPVVIVRGSDKQLRGFFNVCRHHAAAVMTEVAGRANQMRCPYHGWTYSLEGQLKGTPDFSSVCNFDREQNGLVPIEIAIWEQWVFVRLDGEQSSSLNRGTGVPPVIHPQDARAKLTDFLGANLISQIKVLNLANLHWVERRSYTLNCNWKVFVDNYLDGGYHVPHLHKGLDSSWITAITRSKTASAFACSRVRWSAAPKMIKLAQFARVSARFITGSIPTS